MPRVQRPVTDEDRQRVRDLHAQGKGRNAIARALGRSGQTITAIAEDLGLSFDRSAVAIAVEARKTDAKALRAALQLDYLRDAQRLRQQLWEPHEYRDHGGRDFVEARWIQDEPTSADKLRLMQASTLASDRSMRLDLHDADQGAEGAKSMLGALAVGLRAAYEQMPPEESENVP